MKIFWLMFLLGFAAFVWGGSDVGRYLDNWIGKMNDPTERGLAYVAVAIAWHALVSGSQKVEIEVVRRGSGPDEVVAK